jgi:hypothetical protein
MYKIEFPDFKLDVTIPAGFVDNSWHNNVMPCWIREMNDERVVVLWIDYSDPALRNHPQNARFVLHVMDNTLTDVHESFITADYNEILLQLIDHFFPWIDCTYDQLMEFRGQLWAKVPDDDHSRNSKELELIAEIDNEILARSLTVGVK